MSPKPEENIVTTSTTRGTSSGPAALLKDCSAGLVVFLVALPLCLGIALASDAPLSSGIIAGVVGGIVVGALSGSNTSVSGPAAGLTAVVATQIATLGSFEAFLVAVVLAGALQLGLGLLKAGVIKDFIPTSVIKGLLAAIGLILIIKQLPYLVGWGPTPTNAAETGSGLAAVHWGSAVVGLLCLAVLVGWGKVPALRRSPVPGPLVVVLFGVAISELLRVSGSALSLTTTHLVQVPVSEPSRLVDEWLAFPDWSQLTNTAIIPAAITLAMVASLETLLNLEAVDKLDPRKRVSPANRELVAQGLGNMTAGLIGGLPVTSVVVRGSVNVGAGATSKRSAVIHGVMLVSMVVALPMWLNRIPLASLAAILIATGFKLASPQLLKQMWAQGRGVFLPFAVTVGMILATDLLVGVIVGLGISTVFILRSNQQHPIRRVMEKHVGGEVLRIELPSHVSFLNRLALARALAEVPDHGHVLLDARGSNYIDPDILTLVLEFQRDAGKRQIKVSTRGLKHHYSQVDDQLLYVDYSTRELRDELTPSEVVQILQSGNQRFTSGQSLLRDLGHLRRATSEEQHPLAVVLAGTSSRTPVELIFDVGLGDISCIRTTASWGSDGVMSSLEYAVLVDRVRLIVLVGHTRNEAIRFALDDHSKLPAGSQHLTQLLEGIRHNADPELLERWSRTAPAERGALVDEVARRHLGHAAQRIIDLSPAIRAEIDAGEVGLVGCMYDIESGAAQFFDLLDKPSVEVPAVSKTTPLEPQRVAAATSKLH